MVFLETMLASKFNPLVSLGRSGSLGLKGFVNKFNADAELLDDLVPQFLISCRLYVFSPLTFVERPLDVKTPQGNSSNFKLTFALH